MSLNYDKIPSPCYVLEEERLEQNLQLIRSVADQAGVEIILAFKGFAMWSTFNMVKRYLGGASASSRDEARLSFEEFGTKAHTYAPAYKEDDFKEILSYSSHLTFNSLSQYDKFKPWVEQHNEPISIGLRVNPEFSDVATDLYNPASPQSRLGVTAKHLGEGLPQGIEGLHFHVLCESSSFSLQKVLVHFEERFGHLLKNLKWVNMGGGHLITRKGYDTEHLTNLLIDFREKHDVEIILEPGSAIAWETGDLVSTVMDIVENNGVKTAILDVSFTCHMPDCLEMPYRPSVKGTNSTISGKGYPYRLGGLSCLAGDFLEEYSFDQELNPGDKVIFEDMMHYTMVKTTTFNGVPHPSIGIWHKDNSFELVRRFGYQDYKGRLS